MWKIPRMWDGGQCIIIGGGPSLVHQFGIPKDIVTKVRDQQLTAEAYSPFLSSIHDEHIIGVNMSYRLGSWVDCVFFGDAGFMAKSRPDLFEYKGLRVTCHGRNQMHNSYLKVINRDKTKPKGISFKENCVSWNGNSGAAAINLAVHFGVKRIFLLGFDMSLDEKENQHWHKFYTTGLKTVLTTFERHIIGFPIIAKDLEGKVEIINCNPDSQITCFKKANIKDYF